MKFLKLLTALMFSSLLPASANNIIVSNVAIADQDSVTKTANIVFNLSWENSWRLTTGPANWDAAWVFVKYHNGDNVWRHAKLGTLASNHLVPAGAELSVGLTGANALGAFIYRSATGSGNNAWTGIKLKWNYGADGILDTAIITADVQAIEMVYVPQGSFYAGDGATIQSFVRGDSTTLPYQISSSGKIDIGNTVGEIGGRNYGISSVASTSIYPPVFPNGFAAYYCMKYEASFEQLGRAISSGLPNPINFSGAPNQAFVSNGTSLLLASYLSWSGLRPMSIFEYEKACRGPVFPVGGEYAWGTAVAASSPYTLADVGLATERVATGYDVNKGNCTYSRTITGPTRVGMYAKSSYTGATSARIQSGSGYWGIMDLTGNAAEPVCEATPATLNTLANFTADPANYVQVGASYYYYPSTNFRGTHGNGTATPPADWNMTFTGFTFDPLTFISYMIAPVSAAPDPYSAQGFLGIRGVRSAP